jgi:hypothetical protein
MPISVFAIVDWMIKISEQNNTKNNIAHITKILKTVQKNICGQYVPEAANIRPVG